MRKETRKISLPRKFADDVKLRSRIYKLEGKAATSRGLDRLEKWKPKKSPTLVQAKERKANDRVPLLP